MSYTCAVATPHTLATDAACDAVRSGGNALDAALAAAATLAVVYPHNTSVGGDLIALVRTPDGRVTCVNASGPAQSRADRAALAARHGDAMPVTGPDTITVPGAVAGWDALHEAGAARPWPAHFEAAVRHAAATPVVRGLAEAIADADELIAADPGMREVFRPGGRPLAAGDTLRQDALAATLAELAAHGPATLYGGPLGARLSDWLGLDDLARFEVERTAPLSRAFRGYEVHTSPPNTHGFLLLQALGARGPLAAAFHRGIADRAAYLADPRFVPVDVDTLLDPDRPDLVAPASAVSGRATGDTVAVVTADSDGLAVSLIQSLFHGFGSGVLDPSTGILLHNRGSFFSLDPASPNVIAPGKRPAHTLMPVIVTKDGRPAWVAGTMGGKAQPQILTQVLLRLLEGADPAAAVAAPRFVVGGLEVGQREDTISAEADLPELGELAATGAPLVELPSRSEWVGHAQVVAADPFAAGSDPRSDGSAVVVHM
ncbi:gamma-glutamyltransferase family protein [Nonomuraea sp. bgisy101]|uniref:gamma-glutamyltransferase family protein n=1 Tax=Nonomuraea sp. bgisy101 TaxID=3413784 RepID=UPI003D74605B